MTLRDLYNVTAAARGHWVIYGTPQRIADKLEEWFTGGMADGFVIMPAYFPGAFDDFVNLVVPELQRRGLFRRDYSGPTSARSPGFAATRIAVRRQRLRPMALSALAHWSVSSRNIWVNSAGVSATAIEPKSDIRFWTSGSFAICAITSANRAMTGCAVPAGANSAFHELDRVVHQSQLHQRGDLRHMRAALGRGDGERAHRARGQLAHRIRHVGECELNLAGDDRRGRQGAAAIGHGGELGAGLDAKYLRRELHEAAGTDRAVAEPIGHRLAERGELTGGARP